MARKGGNPNINQNPETFSTERSEPLLKQMQLRIPQSMWAQLQQQEDWREFVREAIARALAEQANTLP
jgi:hypothetical protein